MKITEESAFPALNIRLETKEEVHHLVASLQKCTLPYHLASNPERFKFVRELEEKSRDHFMKFKDI